MKSPCHACDLKNADKNGDRCLRCEARDKYARAIEGRILDPDIKIIREGNQQQKEGANMGARGECSNCGRMMSLPKKNMCGTCNRVFDAAPEDEKMAALEVVKARLLSGGIVPRGFRKAKVPILPEPVTYKFPEGIPAVAKMPLYMLVIRAETALELKSLFDKTFQGNSDMHLKMVIMAAIVDAYRDGYNTRNFGA